MGQDCTGEAAALVSALAALLPFHPEDHAVPVLRHALVALLAPAMPAAGSAPSHVQTRAPNGKAETSGPVEAWCELRARVVAARDGAGLSTAALAKATGLAPTTLRNALGPHGRPGGREIAARLRRWLAEAELVTTVPAVAESPFRQNGNGTERPEA